MVEVETAAERFWQFALAVYLPEEARAAFLRLQDRDGADVPLLLYCLWCGSKGVVLRNEVMVQAIAFSRLWRAERVEPLRALRQSWKDAPGALAPDISEAARQHVAKAEQAIERLQMNHLAGLRADDEGAPDAIAVNLASLSLLAGLSLDQADIAIVSALAIAFSQKEA